MGGKRTLRQDLQSCARSRAKSLLQQYSRQGNLDLSQISIEGSEALLEVCFKLKHILKREVAHIPPGPYVRQAALNSGDGEDSQGSLSDVSL